MDSSVPVVPMLQEEDDELRLHEAATMVLVATTDVSWNGEGEWP